MKITMVLKLSRLLLFDFWWKCDLNTVPRAEIAFICIIFSEVALNVSWNGGCERNLNPPKNLLPAMQTNALVLLFFVNSKCLSYPISDNAECKSNVRKQALNTSHSFDPCQFIKTSNSWSQLSWQLMPKWQYIRTHTGPLQDHCNPEGFLKVCKMFKCTWLEMKMAGCMERPQNGVRSASREINSPASSRESKMLIMVIDNAGISWLLWHVVCNRTVQQAEMFIP